MPCVIQVTFPGIEDPLFKSLKLKQQDSNVEVSWDPIPLREQTAFIQGYILYGLDEYGTVSKVETGKLKLTFLSHKETNWEPLFAENVLLTSQVQRRVLLL